ncbi:MAG: permease [Acholeplasmataceae bacterium]|nr:permease [Acholeplasmataceae bacterium]
MLSDFFSALNNALFKMTWLQSLVDRFLVEVIGIETTSQLFAGLSFLIYDVIKIFILLSTLIFISSYIQTYITVEKTKQILGGKKGPLAHLTGALLGTVTPFCSCSSIPIFIGFTRAGLPVGVTFSFLISSPLVDLASIILIAGVFNWSVALIYVTVGIIIAVIGGMLIEIFGMERYVEPFVRASITDPVTHEADSSYSINERIKMSFVEVKGVISRVWIYILVGVGIGAFIHGYVPETFITTILSGRSGASVFLATFAGIPMYADIFGALPIAEALVNKGVPLGTVLSFMMAVTALSLPSLIMMKKVIKKELLLMFVSIVVIGIILVGFLFNFLTPLLI